MDPTPNQAHSKETRAEMEIRLLHSCSAEGDSLAAPFLKPRFRKPLLPLPGCLMMGNVLQCPLSSRTHSSTPGTPATSDTANSSVMLYPRHTMTKFLYQVLEEMKNSK